MATPNHQRLVNAVYPVKAGDTTANGTAMSYLMYYAKQRPVKLLKVGAYLERKIEADQRARNAVHLRVSLEIVDGLISACHSNLNVFGPYVLRLVLKLLRSDELDWISRATATFLRLAGVESHDLASATHSDSRELFVEVTETFVGLAAHVGDLEHAAGCRLAGLKGLIAIVRAPSLLRAENQALLGKIIPVTWTNLRHATIADLSSFAEHPDPMETEQYRTSAVIVAATVIRDAAAKANATTAPLIISKMFQWLDEYRLWETKGLFEQMFSLIAASLTPKYTGLLAAECTRRLSGKNPKDQSELYRTRLIAIMNHIFATSAGGASGLPMLELVDILVSHVTPGPLELPQQIRPQTRRTSMEVMDSESSLALPELAVVGAQELNLAIFSCIELLASTLILNNVKYDCLELLLNRFSKEDERTNRNLQDEQLSMHGPYLQLMYTVATISTEGDFVSDFNPSVLLGLADLLVHNSRIVRLATFAMIKQMFSHLLSPASLSASTLSSKARKENATRMLNQFGPLLHKRVFTLLTALPSLAPTDLGAAIELLLLLLELYGPQEVSVLVPLVLRVQKEAAAVSVAEQALRHLLLNHAAHALLTAAASGASATAALEWLTQLKAQLEAKQQWKAWMDCTNTAFVRRLLRETTLNKMDKRERRKDEASVSVSEAIAPWDADAFAGLLADTLSAQPSALVMALKTKYVEPSESSVKFAVNKEISLARSRSSRRHSAFVLSEGGVAPGTRARALMDAMEKSPLQNGSQDKPLMASDTDSGSSTDIAAAASAVPGAAASSDLTMLLKYRPRHFEDSSEKEDDADAADDAAETAHDSSDDAEDEGEEGEEGEGRPRGLAWPVPRASFR